METNVLGPNLFQDLLGSSDCLRLLSYSNSCSEEPNQHEEVNRVAHDVKNIADEDEESRRKDNCENGMRSLKGAVEFFDNARA